MAIRINLDVMMAKRKKGLTELANEVGITLANLSILKNGKDAESLAKDTFHSTAEQAACMAQLVGAGKLLLGHFSARYPNPDSLLAEAQAIFPNSYICSDGDVYEVPTEKRRI